MACSGHSRYANNSLKRWIRRRREMRNIHFSNGLWKWIINFRLCCVREFSEHLQKQCDLGSTQQWEGAHSKAHSNNWLLLFSPSTAVISFTNQLAIDISIFLLPISHSLFFSGLTVTQWRGIILMAYVRILNSYFFHPLESSVDLSVDDAEETLSAIPSRLFKSMFSASNMVFLSSFLTYSLFSTMKLARAWFPILQFCRNRSTKPENKRFNNTKRYFRAGAWISSLLLPPTIE